MNETRTPSSRFSALSYNDMCFNHHHHHHRQQPYQTAETDWDHSHPEAERSFHHSSSNSIPASRTKRPQQTQQVNKHHHHQLPKSIPTPPKNTKKKKKKRISTYVTHPPPPKTPKPNHTLIPRALNTITDIDTSMQLIHLTPDPGDAMFEIDLITQ